MSSTTSPKAETPFSPPELVDLIQEGSTKPWAIRKLPVIEVHRELSPDGERVYHTPDGILASVTTVLAGSRDNSSLARWREEVGHSRADFLRNYGAYRGTATHAVIEQFLDTGEVPKIRLPVSPYWNSIRPFLRDFHVTSIVQETAVWHPLGYAGMLDCIAYTDHFPGEPILLDWKTADKPPNKLKLYDYTLQAAAYVAGANHVYARQGLKLRRAAVVTAVCARPYQVEWLDEKACTQLLKHFEARLKRYTFARTRR
jgi:hypothetical protein